MLKKAVSVAAKSLRDDRIEKERRDQRVALLEREVGLYFVLRTKLGIMENKD